MNGQNGNLPAWLSLGLKAGAVVIGATIAFQALSSQITATDTLAQNNKIAIERHEQRIDTLQLTQREVVVMLKEMNKTLDEIRADSKEIKKDMNQHVRK